MSGALPTSQDRVLDLRLRMVYISSWVVTRGGSARSGGCPGRAARHRRDIRVPGGRGMDPLAAFVLRLNKPWFESRGRLAARPITPLLWDRTAWNRVEPRR